MSIEAELRVCKGEFVLDVAFELSSTGITAIFGPSGCGKTTLLRTLAGLERQAQGRLVVAGQVWQDQSVFLPPHRRAIGYVFQQSKLFPHLSIQANIEYGRKRRQSPNPALHLNLDAIIELLDISHLLGRKPKQLSGGEQQRVAIARALAASPALLLLDEPLAALDMARKREILPYLEQLNQELAIPMLYVSHSRREVARLANELVILDEGRIRAQGPPARLFARFDLPLAHEAGAESLIQAQACGYDAQFKLNQLCFSGGCFLVSGAKIPRGKRIRLQILARDVSLTLTPPKYTSILNVFPAEVERIYPEPNAQATVRLRLGNDTLLCRITQKSVAHLNLYPQKPVFAQIKAIAVLNEF